MSLEEKCETVLDDQDLLEEQKIETIEELVEKHYEQKGGLSSGEIERKVLDILWAHREKTSEIGQVRRKKVGGQGHIIRVDRKPALWASSIQNPPPSDPTKLIQTENGNSDIRRENHGKATSLSPNIPNAAKAGLPGPPSVRTNPTDTSAISSSSTSSWEEDYEQTMSPFDILRSILGPANSDKDIMEALEKNDFDIQSTLETLLDGGGADDEQKSYQDARGSSMSTVPSHDTPEKENIVCKYFLKYGECLRADCKYSHDLSSRICRFWLQGSCLAGDYCLFLHEVPESLLQRVSLNDEEPVPVIEEHIQVTEEEFPALGRKPKSSKKTGAIKTVATKPAKQLVNKPPVAQYIKLHSKPTGPSTSNLKPVPKGAPSLNRKVVEIKEPQLVPWENIDYGINKEYVAYRLRGFKHGEMRNKYLQLAAQSWHKNEAGAARMLSKKGQNHNEIMIEAYKKASELLYEQRLRPKTEIFLDLHGIEMDDSIDLLEQALVQTETEERSQPRPVYAICGAGHHWTFGKEDKLTKKVKDYLHHKGYEWKAFKTSQPKYGQIIGIDPWSHL